MGYPTYEREVHTLFSRFETALEYQFEQQLLEFITNKNHYMWYRKKHQVTTILYNITTDVHYVNTADFKYKADTLQELSPSNS